MKRMIMLLAILMLVSLAVGCAKSGGEDISITVHQEKDDHSDNSTETPAE